jgi:competence protein ComEA
MKRVPFIKSYLNIIYGVLIGLLAAGVLWLAASPPRGEQVILLSTPTPGMVTVYVSGAVATPGVYSLPSGSRVDAAVNAAGGFLQGAETDQINLAELLEDGVHIDVPGVINTGHINAGRVNINTATAEDLDALPGIGSTTAQSIVDYRLNNGPFSVIQDIQNVPGVGPATYDLIKDYITVGP